MSNAPGASFDPYQPPKTIEPKPNGGAGIRYMYAYNYIFENPNWMTNVIYLAVCFIIPVVGPLLALGYQFETVEFLYRNPGRMYPNFDFNKFSQYLVRGLWPFLAQMVIGFPLGMVIGIIYFVGAMLLGAVAGAAGKDVGPIVAIVGGLFLFFVLFCLEMVAILLLQPIMLRAGLSQDFGQAMKIGWAIDFLKRTWLELILIQLFFAVTAMPLMMLGMLVCCIGMYPALAIVVLAQSCMLSQLYSLFLARGGEPIPLKDPAMV